MDEREAYRRVVLLIPEPFFKAWNELVGLCEAIKGCEPALPTVDRWPVLALSIKAAHTTLSIATLAAIRQWPDAWVLGRSLFETEVFVKWLLESDTDERIKAYLAEIEDEKGRLKRKMLEGQSVAAQVMKDLIPPEVFNAKTDGTKSRRRTLGSVRNRAQRTNMDRSYDLPYWIASIFSHSHALSLAQWHPVLKADQSPLIDIFSFHDNGLASWMVLEATPMSALDTFELANYHFKLGLADRITAARESFHDVVAKVSKGQVRFASDIERGEVRLEHENGTVRSYRPKRTGRDPLDEPL